MSSKPEVGLIFTISPLKNSFNVKCLENGDRYHDGVNGSRIRNHPLAIDWHRDLWPWMTLNSPCWKRHALGRYTFHWNYFLLLLFLASYWRWRREKAEIIRSTATLLFALTCEWVDIILFFVAAGSQLLCYVLRARISIAYRYAVYLFSYNSDSCLMLDYICARYKFSYYYYYFLTLGRYIPEGV